MFSIRILTRRETDDYETQESPGEDGHWGNIFYYRCANDLETDELIQL